MFRERSIDRNLDRLDMLEIKEIWKRRTLNGEPTPKCTVFWDSQGVNYTDYLAKNKTMTRRYCADLTSNCRFIIIFTSDNFFLFSNLKNSLTRYEFESRKEVIAGVKVYFEDIQQTYFPEGLKKLGNRWLKRIELNIDYVEKYIAIFLNKI